MRRGGVTATGFLIVVAVLGLASFILYVVNRSVLESAKQGRDIKNMRSVYVATSLYEEENNEGLPSNLLVVRKDVPDTTTYQAANDPYTSGSAFPLDPAFPAGGRQSPFRISFTYLPQWIANGQLPATSFQRRLKDPTLGFIACYWYGVVEDDRSGLSSSGPILRINMDGSARTVQRTAHGKLGGQELFLKK